MKRRLFEDLVVSAAGPRARGGLAWPVSVSLHAAAVAGVLALPAFTTEAMPDPPAPPVPRLIALATVTPPPPAPAPPVVRPAGGGPRRAGPVVAPRRIVSIAVRDDVPPALVSDVELPIDVPICINCNAPPSIGIPATTEGGSTGPGGPGEATGPLPVGGLIRPPTKLRDARPIYPDLARATRAHGSVVIECIIDTGGRVTEVRALSGHPLLQEPALDAVRQWRYTPTLLNGVAVSVIMTVTVNFILS